jgi:hypothetical protein
MAGSPVSDRTDLSRRATALLLSCHLLLGLLIFRDYGLSWDEPFQRHGCGIVNRRFLVHGDRRGLLEGTEKYHGPAFEMVLIFAEKAFRVTDPLRVYQMRHLLTFLVFHAAVVVFYRVVRRRHGSRAIGLLGAAFLVLSPRLFAESFYNSKDMVFLSAYVFALATLLRWRRQSTWASAGLHALASAFLIAVRIPGILVPALTVLVALVEVWTAWRQQRPATIRLRTLGLYFGLLVACTILFWPVLMLGPVRHFIAAFQEMQHFPWQGFVLYRGEWIPAQQVPWDYAFCWIGLTTPPLYLALFFVGIGGLAWSVGIRPLRFLSERPADGVFVLALVLPLTSVVVLHSTLYDGWRHLYFVYPPLLYVAVCGYVSLASAVQSASQRLALRCALPAIMALFLAGTALYIVRAHPYQNVYFNRLAGPDLSAVRGRYDLDYWGLSCQEGLKQLLDRDPSPTIRVFAETANFAQSAYLLPRSQAKRLDFVKDPAEADYYATHYRAPVPSFREEVCAICVDGTAILTVGRLGVNQENDSHARADGASQPH